MNWEKELQSAINSGLVTREKIMEIYNAGFDVEIKSDNSPVTLADKTADRMIRENLQKEFPDYAFLTEESEDDKKRLENDLVWIVDPVDGTKNFVARDGGFTTNIALSYKHEIVVGVVVVPTSGEVYYAVKGEGAYYMHDGVIDRIHVSNKTNDLTVLCSVFHSNDAERELIKKYSDRIGTVKTFGSSLKACKIAEGVAELSYRLSPNTKEWDTAAIQLIVKEAGGVFVQPDGTELKYNRDDVYNRNGYIIANKVDNVLL